MIKINLLPPEYKNEFENKKMKFPIFSVLFLSLAIIVLSIAIILITHNLQKNSLAAIKNQNQAYENYLNSDKNKNIEDNIKEVESLSNKVGKIIENNFDWTNILIELSEKVPSEVILHKLEVNKQDKNIKIIGFAQNRQDLLDFESELSDYENFTNIILPSSYLISPNAITFKMTLDILEDKN